MAKFHTVTDDFTVPGNLGLNWFGWYGTAQVNADGKLWIDATVYSGAITHNNDLSDSSVHIKVEPASPGHVAMRIRNASDVNQYSIYAYPSLGEIHFVDETAASDTTITFDGVAHAWWRFRHSVGTLYWETSPDGSTWTIRKSAAVAGSLLTDVDMKLEAGPYPAAPTGPAKFDKLNLTAGTAVTFPAAAVARTATVLAVSVSGASFPATARPPAVGRPTAVNSPTPLAGAPTKWAAYSDLFPGASLGALWDATGGTVTVASGRMALAAPTNASATSRRLDLAESELFARMLPAEAGQLDMQLLAGGFTTVARIYVRPSAGTIWFEDTDAAVDDDAVYDPVAMAFWRFRHSAGTLHYETSPDGRDWTGRFTAPFTDGEVDDIALRVAVDPDPDSAAGNAWVSQLNVADDPAAADADGPYSPQGTWDAIDDNELARFAVAAVNAGPAVPAVLVSPGVTGQFQVSQGVIWDPNGLRYVPVGVHLQGPNGWWADEAVALAGGLAARWGINAVRVVVCEAGGCEGHTGQVVTTNDQLDDIVAAYTSRRLVVIVDYHQIEAGTTPTSLAMDRAEVFWRATAARHAANPYVWFGLLPRHEGGVGALARWLADQQRLITAVRAVNALNVVVISDTHAGQGTTTSTVSPVAVGQSAVLDEGGNLIDPAGRVIYDLTAFDMWGSAGTDAQRRTKLEDYLDRAGSDGRAVIIGAVGYAPTAGPADPNLLAARAVYEVARIRGLGVFAWTEHALTTAGWDPAKLTAFGEQHRTYAIGHATHIALQADPTGSIPAVRAATGQYEVVAGRIYTPTGAEIIPVGTSLMGPNGFWIDNPASAATLDAVKAAGFNTVRLTTCRFPGCQCCTNQPTYTNANDLVSVVRAVTSAGLVCIVDNHHHMSGAILSAQEISDNIAWWTSYTNLAEWKSNPNVWFELFNEPESGVDTVDRWVAQHQQVLNAIRAGGNNNMVVINDSWAGQGSGVLWSVDPLPAGTSGVLDENLTIADPVGRVVYDLHAYDVWGAPSTESGADRYSQAERNAKLQDYITRAKAGGRALLIGEVGFYNWEQESTGVSHRCTVTGGTCPPTGSGQRLAARAVYELGVDNHLGVIAWNGYELAANRSLNLGSLTEFGRLQVAYARKIRRLLGTGGGDILSTGGSTGDAKAVLRQQLIDDMSKPHTGDLEGVPEHYDWANQGRVGWGNDARGYVAAVPWGEVYGDAAGVGSTNTLVSVRNMHCAVLSKATGRWTIIKSAGTPAAGMDGGYFTNDFQGNVTGSPAPMGTNSDNGRTAEPGRGYNFHYFPQGRGIINPGDIAAMCAWHEARLIIKDPNGPDDRAQARFLCGAGGDYWQDQNAGWPNNGDFAIGRHRHLTSEWQTFTAHTMSAAQLASDNLPPIILAAGSSGGGGTTPPPDPGPGPTTGAWVRPTGRAIKVNFMGDSITYLQSLQSNGLTTVPSRMSTFGYQIELVGTITESLTGVKHDGRGGWCIDDSNNRCSHTSGFDAGGYLQLATGFLQQTVPDVIVLNLGTNDRYSLAARPDAEINTVMGQLLDVIKAAAPQAMVLVTKLKYWGDATGGANQNGNLNTLYGQTVTAKAAAGMNVRLVDTYQFVTLGSDYDAQWGVHPSVAGVGKLAQGNAQALKDLFDSVGTGTTPTPGQNACATAVATTAVGPATTTFITIASQTDLTANGLPGTWDAANKLWTISTTPTGVLSGLRVLGGIFYEGVGALQIEDCEILNSGPSFAMLYCTTVAGPLRARRCRIARPAVDPATVWGPAAVRFSGAAGGWVEFCDISGNIAGLHVLGSNNRVFRNYVHDLATGGSNRQRTGILVTGSAGHELTDNRIVMGTLAGREAACIYVQPTTGAVTVQGNLLSGSDYQLLATDGDLTVTGNCFNSPRMSGPASLTGATLVSQSGNTADGAPLAL